jgi:hypothetical protein
MKAKLQELFVELDNKIKLINRERKREQQFAIAQANVQLLGQVSLFSDYKVSSQLPLKSVKIVDALLKMHHILVEEFETILSAKELVYNEDSNLIWIPPHASFVKVFTFENLVVEALDAESALLSLAVRSPQENKQIVQAAIDSGLFPALAARIQGSGGKLENFGH